MPATDCSKTMTEDAKLRMGLASVWIVIREYRTVNGTPETVKAWDDVCIELAKAVEAGDAATTKFGAEQNISDAEKQFLVVAVMKLEGLNIVDAQTCKFNWPEYACYANWAARQPIAKLQAMTPAEIKYVCEPAIKANPLYVGQYPSPAPGANPPSSSNWTPWLIGGAVVVALGGVAYALTREPSRRRGTVAAANPAPTSVEIDVFAPGRIMPDAKKVGKKVFSDGRVEYWYQLRNGGKMVYKDREQFRYSLRNSANVSTAEQLVKQLDREVPSA